MLAFRASSEEFLRVGSRVHVGNVDIPDNKKLVCALQYIKGIGHATPRQLLGGLQIGDKPTWQLTALELETLRNEVLNYKIGQNSDKNQH